MNFKLAAFKELKNTIKVPEQSAFVSFEVALASDFFGKAKEIDPPCFGA